MCSELADRHIILGVTGGIAAYKAVDLASKLRGGGAVVHCILTENACKLIGPKSFEAITGQPVFTSLWDCQEEFRIGHIKLADVADAVVVAPATANIIGKVAGGICDDLLSTTLCACWEKPILMAPAMNDRMWGNPVVGRNIELIKERGIRVIGPETGRLACGTEGTGRMSEPQSIADAVAGLFS